MVRSVSPIDFDLGLKFLRFLSSEPGLKKEEIQDKINLRNKKKLNYIITDFNKNHLDLVKKENGYHYYLKIRNDKIPNEKASLEDKLNFWRELFLKFPLYIEVIQSFSFGNTIKNVSKYTGVSLVSTKEIVRWGLMVDDLKEINKDFFKITHRSIEELLNRIAVCQLGNLGCSLIKRERKIKESGMKVDVYGYDSTNDKEYYIESESSASKLQQGLMQAHIWVKEKENIEKWVLIPKETLNEVTFPILKKKYRMAKNRKILIKICNLNFKKTPKIINFKIPGAKDRKKFNLFIKLYNSSKELEKNKGYSIFKKSFIDRMIRFGLLESKGSKIYPTFKV